MSERMVRGATAWVRLPHGEFVVDVDRDAVLIAGGTGIAPFLGALGAANSRISHRTLLIYGARSPSVLLHRDLIIAAIERDPHLEVELFCEDGAAEELKSISHEFGGVRCSAGRIDLGVMRGSLGRYLDCVFYLSGPPAMVQGFRSELLRYGVEPSCVRSDEWE